MKRDEQRYAQAGTITEFVTVPQLGHQWSRNHTPKAWISFVQNHLGLDRIAEQCVAPKMRKMPFFEFRFVPASR